MKYKQKWLPAFFIILLFHARAMADGGATFFIIRFSIETTQHEVSKGYGYISEGNIIRDSFNSTGYLMRLLDQSYEDRSIKDSMAYYKGRLKYSSPANPLIKDPIGGLYTLTDLEHLSFKRIKKMRIDTIMPFSWVPGIMSPLKMADTIWLKNKPVRDIEIEPLSCYYRVIIYESSPRINDIMKKIALLVKKINDMQQVNEEANNKERQIYELLKKLKGEKVVVIEACSC
ncbi:MAG: hypothetical protein V4658_14885 [Bacteroidota bacterium]